MLQVIGKIVVAAVSTDHAIRLLFLEEAMTFGRMTAHSIWTFTSSRRIAMSSPCFAEV